MAPEAFTPDLPRRVDVVVIGGGIAGASTALFLREKGISVTLCEKGAIGGEQSSRNWGWCRSMARDGREIPLMRASLQIWQDFRSLLGDDVGFRRCGIACILETDADVARYDAWLREARDHGIESRLVSTAELARLLPGLTRGARGAIFTPGDGRAEPARATLAVARAVADRGGVVLAGCAVRTVELTGGRISGVVTERGVIAASAVVLAGGAWSRLFCGNIGLSLPQLKVLASVLRTDPLPDGPGISSSGPDFAFRKNEDGGYTVAPGGRAIFDITPDSFRLFAPFLPALKLRGIRLRLSERFFTELRQPRRWKADVVTPFEGTRTLEPEPDDAVLDRALAIFRTLHPAFAGAREARRWGGLIDVTPDAVPVISQVEAIAGFHLCTGFSGHGFGIGPAAGRLMADIVAGDAPIVDPSPFRFSRFSDGTPVRIEARF